MMGCACAAEVVGRDFLSLCGCRCGEWEGNQKRCRGEVNVPLVREQWLVTGKSLHENVIDLCFCVANNKQKWVSIARKAQLFFSRC